MIMSSESLLLDIIPYRYGCLNIDIGQKLGWRHTNCRSLLEGKKSKKFLFLYMSAETLKFFEQSLVNNFFKDLFILQLVKIFNSIECSLNERFLLVDMLFYLNVCRPQMSKEQFIWVIYSKLITLKNLKNKLTPLRVGNKTTFLPI